jgi:hypothetical protein
MTESRRGTERMVQAHVGGQRLVGLLLKRTYLMLPHGRVALANDSAQEPLYDAEVPYEQLAPPRVSPVRYGNDALAFKSQTDVILQGSGYTYHPRVIETQVSVRIGAVKREIRVVGDRRGEWGPDGPAFSEPLPFLSLPVRYDLAYGGLDAAALERSGLPALDPARAVPFLTPYHSPRNPAGKGYLLELDRASFEGLSIPNLEYPDDPLTPQRLVVSPAGAWASAPIPAGMDWQPSYCYPRSERLAGSLERPLLDPAQAASPGFTFPSLRLDDEIELNNLHPSSPLIRCSLPAEAPRVLLSLAGRQVVLQPHLNTVVLRPGLREIVVVWLAFAPADRLYPPEALEQLPRAVSFRRA